MINRRIKLEFKFNFNKMNKKNNKALLLPGFLSPVLSNIQLKKALAE